MKILLAIVAFALYTTQSSASVIDRTVVQARAPAACGNASDAATLLRAVRTDLFAHYYTINATQMEHWIAVNNGRSQGDAARVFGSQEGSTALVYGLDHPSQHDNIYTTDSNETVTLAEQGWTDLGVYWYACTSQICDSVPFYVVDNPAETDHIYTTNITERDTLINSQEYVDEGIAMYVLPFTGQSPAGCGESTYKILWSCGFS